jgi:ABC-2 type transport system ATP-binding protein
MMSSSIAVAAEVDALTVRFGSLEAVQNASFAVEKGSVYALIGRNGSGKSTTMRCLLGQLKATAGTARVFGLDSWRHRRKIMGRVGVAPEVPDIPPTMTPARVSDFVAPLYPGWDSSGFRDRLDRFGVSPSARFSTLSKGQRKSVSLALALSSSPEMVFLDDPTLGLDPVARKGLYDELIGELAERGTTVLITTHDLVGIEGVADRVGVMHQGRIVVDDTLELIKGRFRRLQYPLTEGPDLELPCVGDDVVSSRVIGGIAEVIVSAPDGNSERRIREQTGERLQSESMSLEEIFIALCGDQRGEAS